MALRGALEHPKVLALADALGIMDCFALGILEAFWHHVAKYHDDGDISDVKPGVMCRSIRYTGDAAALWKAMTEAGFIDETSDGRLIVHGWSQHADSAIHARLYRAIRTFADGTKPLPRSIGKAEKETLDKQWAGVIIVADISRTTDGHPLDILPEPEPEPVPVPEPVVCESSDSKKSSVRFKPPAVAEVIAYGKTRGLPAAECQAFHDYHTSKGWKVGLVSMKDWEAAVRLWEKNYKERQPVNRTVNNSW